MQIRGDSSQLERGKHTHLQERQEQDPGNCRPVGLRTCSWQGWSSFQTKDKLCLTSQIAFYNETAGCVDEGSAMDVTYLDFRKAFDMFSYTMLKAKMRRTE